MINYFQEDLSTIFLNDIPLVDLRSPGEFAEGSFPTAINLPLMNNEERHKVGICYKEKGQQEAIKLGNKLVSGEIKEQRINGWKDFIKNNPNAIFFCLRGGLRSQTVQKWLNDMNIDIPIIEGGYKVLRNFLINSINNLSPKLKLIVLSGNTGGEKTKILNEIASQFPIIDLEGLANHRGSAFGYNLTPQPTQINFENELACTLIKKINSSKNKYIIIEDESKMIGRVSLPDSFVLQQKKSPVFYLEIPLNQRVINTRKLYVEELWHNSHFKKESDFNGFQEIFSAPLERIKKRLGNDKLQLCKELLSAAIEDQQTSGTFDKHDKWIKILLNDYYDPLYEKGMKNKQISARGNKSAFIKYLNILINK